MGDFSGRLGSSKASSSREGAGEKPSTLGHSAASHKAQLVQAGSTGKFRTQALDVTTPPEMSLKCVGKEARAGDLKETWV